MLYISGWFDGEQRGVLGMWEGMRAYSPGRDRQFLLIGPWTHENAATGVAETIGLFEFPPQATLDVRAIELAFFDRYLKHDSSTPAPQVFESTLRVQTNGASMLTTRRVGRAVCTSTAAAGRTP